MLLSSEHSVIIVQIIFGFYAALFIIYGTNNK